MGEPIQVGADVHLSAPGFLDGGTGPHGSAALGGGASIRLPLADDPQEPRLKSRKKIDPNPASQHSRNREIFKSPDGQESALLLDRSTQGVLPLLGHEVARPSRTRPEEKAVIGAGESRLHKLDEAGAGPDFAAIETRFNVGPLQKARHRHRGLHIGAGVRDEHLWRHRLI